MCGICGIVGPGANKRSESLHGMLSAIKHRGPDAHSTYFYSNCAFGHARLSIIDLEQGSQPMRYNNGADELGIVFNGEIYNYKNLRAGISLPLMTQSDTEVIPALYCTKSIADTCRSLVGMFAFALWDEKKRRLVCGRDRFGEKPFYYAVTSDGLLVFASELQAVIASGLIEPKLSKRGLSQYLSLRYIPETHCIYEHIRPLPPGHTLTWQDGNLSVERYWAMPAPFIKPPSREEAVEEIQRLTIKAVSRCLVSDVEVGLLLSGGLDSSTVAALAAKEKILRSFSFGFDSNDERPYAKTVAEKYALPFNELTDSALDLPALVKQMAHVYGEPFADTSAIPTWILCKKIREQVKVALGGDGADELFGGYDHWYQHLGALSGKKTFFSRKSAIAKRHWKDIVKFKNHKLRKLGLPTVEAPEPEPVTFTPDDAIRMDLALWLPGDILRKVDRAAMAHGLELRSPFLDVELAEFVIALPAEYKVSATGNKLIMRQAFSELWPDAVKNRSKQGFGYSSSKWMALKEMHDLQQYYLADKSRKIYSLFPSSALKRYADKKGKSAWYMLVLSVWLEESVWRG